MAILGHKSIQKTLVYTRLIRFEGDEYVCKTAETVNDARSLERTAFDYVTDVDGMKLKEVTT